MNKNPKKRKIVMPERIKESNFLQVFPVIFFTSVLFLAMYVVVYTRPMNQFYWFNKGNMLINGDAYARMVLIIACGAVCLLSILTSFLTGSMSVKRGFFYIPMGIYSVLVLLSYVFSEQKEFALLGFTDRFEGTLTLLSYMIMLFYTYNIVNSVKNVKWVVYSVAIFCGILGLIGVGQQFGFNILNVSFIKRLYVPMRFWDQLDNLSFEARSGISQTLSNQNYVAFYIVIPICLFGSMALGEKNSKRKLIWTALTGLFGFNLIAADSTGGVVGLLVSILAAVVVLNKRLAAWWKSVALVLVVTLVLSSAAFLPKVLPKSSPKPKQETQNQNQAQEAHAQVQNQPQEVQTQTDISQTSVQPEKTENQTPSEPEVTALSEDLSLYVDDIKKLKSYAKYYGASEERKKVDYIVTQEENILFSVEGQELTLQIENQELTGVFDQNGTIPFENEYCNIVTEPLLDGNNLVVVTTDQRNWLFLLTQEGPRYINSVWKLVELDQVPSFGFENNLKFANGRGYIWSRSIPMLKDTFLLGHGADTFCIYFPQDDYAGRYNVGFDSGWTNQVVDKPHNMYLGAAIGTGVLSLIALLVIYGFYAMQSLRIYFTSNYENELDFIGVGIFLGICGFLIAGMANDSAVSVMPLFYGMLGTGLSINHMILKKRPGKA